MKRTLAILLCAALLLSCLPILSAGAKEIGVEQKFKLLLDDIEIAYPHHQANQYYFAELKKTDSWTLIRGGMRDLNQLAKTPDLHYATVGNKLVWSNKNSEPFKSGYGVYDAKSGAFYDLTDAWGRDFSGLRDAWNAMPGDEGDPRECGAQLIGDADRDNEVTILDATRIQRYVAELDADPFTQTLKKDYYFGYPLYKCTDYDRDGDFTIMDATKVQRHIADLPNNIDAKIISDYANWKFIDDDTITKAQLLTDRTALSDFSKQYTDQAPDEKYNDAYFKDHTLIGVYLRLSDMGWRVYLDGAKIDVNGTLTLDFTAKNEEEIEPHNEARFILVEISSAFNDDIKDVKATLKTAHPDYPDLPEVHPITDDKKISVPTGNAISFTGLPTTELVYQLTYPFVENEYVSEHFSQPYTVAIIRTYAQYQSFFSTRYFKKYNGEPIVKDENDQQITESFFEDNAMIVGVGKFDLGEAWLSFDKMYTKASGENVLEVCFNRYDMGDLTDEPYAAPITGYCFAAAKVSKSALGSHVTVYTLPNVKKIPVDLEVYIGTGTDTARATAIAGGGSDPFEYCYTISGGDFVTSYQGMLDKGFRSVKESDPDYELLKPGSFAMTTGYIDKDMLDLPLNCLGYDEEYTLTVRARRTTDGITSAPVTKTFNGIKEKALVAPLTPADKRKSESYVISHAFDYKYITATEMESVKNTIVDYSMGDLHLNEENGSDYILLMRNKSEYDLHFGGIKTARNYSVSYFNDNALIAVVGVGNSGDAVARIDSLAVTDAGGMLYSDARIDYPHPDFGATANTPLVWTIYQVKKSDVQNVSGIGFWNADSMIREIVPEREKMNRIISESGEQCKLLSTDAYQITALSGTQQRYGDWSVFRMNETLTESGYVMVIKDARTFEKYFPATDFRQSYKGFFNYNALIVMVSRGSDDSAVAEMSDFAVVGQSLYVDAHTSTSYLGEPSRPMIWTCVSVDKSDLDGVKEIRFWDSDSMIREIKPTNFTMDFIKTSNEDRHRALDSTAADIEPKSSQARYDLSYSSLNLPNSELTGGYIMMIKDKATLDRHFPAARFNTEAYTDAYFKDNAIIAMVSRGGEDTARADLNALGIVGEQLYVDARVSYHPYFSSDGMLEEMPSSPMVWNFRQVKKSDISGVKSFCFWNSEAMIAPVFVRSGYVPDPTSEYVKDIKTTEITMSSPSESDFSWKPLGSSETGYTLILNSRAALEYYLPGFDTEKKYNDAFFKDSAIIAAVLRGNDATSAAHFGKIGVINNTLFVNAYYTNNQPVIDGTPVAQPTTPTIRTFAKVSKADIKSIGDIQFWNAK